MSKSLNIMIVAGEASGDSHGARLVRAIRDLRLDDEILFFGAAGPKMRAEGVEAVVASDEMSVVGLAKIAGALPMFLRAKSCLKAAAAVRHPEVAILIDFPDFNLKLARSLKEFGIPVVYYISPQLWAWRQYRISAIRKYVDLLLAILPFEQEWYAERGVVHVEYVGNPLAFDVHPQLSKDEFCELAGLDPARPIVSLLPGSRSKEISRILPVLLDTAIEMNKRDAEIQFVLAMAGGGHRDLVNEKISAVRDLNPEAGPIVKVVEGQTFDALAASDAAAVTSGTATLETGIIGTPLAIVYKTSKLNYFLFKPMISVEHYGLINLIAGERLAREMIQDGLTAATLSDELFRLLEPEVNAKMRADLHAAAAKLGSGGASERAAKAILNLIDCS